MTTGTCKKCGKIHATTELTMLPEGEKYVRALAMRQLKGGPVPNIPDSDICKKYGYDPTDLFCDNCIKTLLHEI